MLQKIPRVRWQRFLDFARQAECVSCGATETVCARHYNGLRQHHLGKGRGTKCHDTAAAYLCADCDREFSEGVGGRKDVERSERFLFLVALSHAQYVNAKGGRV